jgi:hypothetical protein
MSSSPPAAPSAETPPQHDARGRFVRGNAGGPGNPFGRRVAELRKIIVDALDDAEMRAITQAMIVRAKAGDVAAARLLYQYALGKPARAANPDRVDIDEFNIREDAAIPANDWMPILNRFTADSVNQLVGEAQPRLEQEHIAAIVTGMKTKKETPASRREARKEAKRLRRQKNAPSPNGSDGGGPKLRFDKHGFPLDMGFGPDRAG